MLTYFLLSMFFIDVNDPHHYAGRIEYATKMQCELNRELYIRTMNKKYKGNPNYVYAALCLEQDWEPNKPRLNSNLTVVFLDNAHYYEEHTKPGPSYMPIPPSQIFSMFLKNP